MENVASSLLRGHIPNPAFCTLRIGYADPYQKLIETSEQMVRQAERVVQALEQQSESVDSRLREQAERVVSLVKRVIAQTRSRVLEIEPMLDLLHRNNATAAMSDVMDL